MPLAVSYFGIDIGELIKAVGYLGLFVIVFAESGLLVGIFLPGDSLLFTAGFLASQGFFNFWVLIVVCTLAAVTGDAAGYWFGRRVGRRLFQREDSRVFKRKHLHTAEAFYAKHGGKTIILARFMPIVRTMAPIVAGAGNMPYRRFTMFNAVGGVLWGAGLTAGGYLLGSTIPEPDKYLLPVVALIIVLSIAPTAIHFAVSHRTEIRSYLRRTPRGAEGSERLP